MDVHDVTPADVPAVSQMLARAFADDPFHGWAIASPAARRRRSPRFFATMMTRELGRCPVLTTPGREAAAIWHCSEASQRMSSEIVFGLRMIEVLRQRLPLVALGTALAGRFHPPTPHWFLVILGVDPQHQRQGYGRAVVQPILDICDDRGQAAYLEASTAANVPYYRRFGFDVVRPFRLPLGPTIYPMLRPANSANQSNLRGEENEYGERQI